nr:ABC transporter permease [Desulfitibacter alkalitolerans]
MVKGRFSINRFMAIVKKEMLQIKRDKVSLGIGIMMPLMFLLIFGYAINTDVEHIPTGVWDQSNSRASRELIAAYEVTGYFHILENATRYDELQYLMDSGHIEVGIVIPHDYAYGIEQNRDASLQILINGSDPTVARTALSAVQLITQNAALELQQQRLDREGMVELAFPIQTETRVLYNPDMDSTFFNIPGLIGLVLQNVTALLTAFAMVREKERGTLEQLLVTPVKPVELIIGKLLPYVAIGMLSFTLVLTAGVLWFKVPVKGSILLLFILGLLFLVTTLSIGLFISTVARNQLQAVFITFAIIFPSVLLSGFMFPRDTMPFVIQALGGIIPLTYFLIILRGIFLKGISLNYLWTETMMLAVFAVIFCTIAVIRFRKNLE